MADINKQFLAKQTNQQYCAPQAPASLAAVSNWMYIIWYLEWIIPGCAKPITDGALQALNPLRILNMIGIVAYATKIAGNMTVILKTLSKQDYMDLEGNVHNKRRLDKAAFKIYDTIVSSIAYAGFFMLNASWVSPFFIAISAGFFVKALYSTTKNAINLYQHHEKTKGRIIELKHQIKSLQQKENTVDNRNQIKKLKLEGKQILAAKKRHQVKLQRAIFDVACMTSFVAFSVLFCFNPAVASIGLLATCLVITFTRGKFTKRATKAKQDAIQASKDLKAFDSTAVVQACKPSINLRVEKNKTLQIQESSQPEFYLYKKPKAKKKVKINVEQSKKVEKPKLSDSIYSLFKHFISDTCAHSLGLSAIPALTLQVATPA